MKEYVIICRTDGAIETAEVPEKHDFRWYPEQIGAKYFEPVHPKGLKDPYLFLCDEEGLYNVRPTINFLGSWLYETHIHEHPIIGDIMILKEETTESGGELVGMSESEADVLSEWLLEHFWEAHDQVMAKIGYKMEK